MSSFFDEASLVMIPSGYKNQKVYSVKPLDGSGDLTFSRASSATRVASNGLIEKVRTNLYPNGSALLSTGWTSVGATLTAGQTDPNGGTTALRVQLAAAQSPYAYILQSFTGSAATYARSVFIKGATAQSIRIVDPHSGVGSTINLTTSYQRFTAVGAGIAPSFGIQFDNDNDDLAKDFTIAFVQIEEGDIATDYIATTTAAVSVGPVSGLPRLDYLGSTCPRLILEPQRSNELQYSEQANNAYWSLFGATISANTTATLDPAGYYGSDKLQEDTSTGGHTYGVSISGGSTTKTLSVFAKAAERNWAALRLYNGSSSFFAYFNLSTGALGSVTAGATSAITSYGNGWYRCSITLALGAGSCEPNIFATTGNGTTSYQGVTGSGIYVYGAQLEAGAYATSYIPTLGASVTRVADAASKTGISSLIGQTEGTVFVDFTINGLQSPYASAISLNDGVPNNYVWLTIFSNGNLRAEVYAGGVVQASIIKSGAVTGGRYKMAFGYKTNDFVLYVNGALVGTDTSGTTFSGTTLSRIDNNLAGIAGNEVSQSTNQALLFKTRLTNAQLAELTA
jgi:hypothetical protein